MNLLSSTAKGDTFEGRIFDLINRLIDRNEFYVNRQKSKVYWKNGYYSTTRNSKVIFDIAIEVFLPGAKDYSHLIIIECKNYRNGVPVDDIEELDSKLSGLTQHNVKAFIFTSSYFQSGTIAVAKNKGIGLVRVFPDDVLEWVNFRKDRNENELSDRDAQVQLTTNFPVSFVALLHTKVFENIPDLLIGLKVIDCFITAPAWIKIPFVPQIRIQQIIDSLPKNDLYGNGKLDASALTDMLLRDYKVGVITDKELPYFRKQKVLGKLT